MSVGNRVTARLSMAVRSGLRTTLQRWNGSAWVSAKWVYLNQGTGLPHLHCDDWWRRRVAVRDSCQHLTGRTPGRRHG